EQAGHGASRAVIIEGRRWVEAVRDESGMVAGVLVREQRELRAQGEGSLRAHGEGGSILRGSVRNTTRLPVRSKRGKEADVSAVVAEHMILRASDAEFVSTIDPPEEYRSAADSCCSEGLWPVLAGEGGGSDTVLAAPIILPDHPRVAEESPGD